MEEGDDGENFRTVVGGDEDPEPEVPGGIHVDVGGLYAVYRIRIWRSCQFEELQEAAVHCAVASSRGVGDGGRN